MKRNEFGMLTAALALSLLAACSPSDSQNSSSLDSLNKALGVASTTMDSFESNGSNVNKDNAMDVFSKDYANNLNNTSSLAHLGPMGVKPEQDGSFVTYSDTNKNNIKDEGEKDLFKLEADAENQRLVASDETTVAEQPHSGMMNGFLMGMLLSNMMGRQRSSGVNPAKKRATPPPRKSASKSAPSAKSRAGSGSHASGK